MDMARTSAGTQGRGRDRHGWTKCSSVMQVSLETQACILAKLTHRDHEVTITEVMRFHADQREWFQAGETTRV